MDRQLKSLYVTGLLDVVPSNSPVVVPGLEAVRAAQESGEQIRLAVALEVKFNAAAANKAAEGLQCCESFVAVPAHMNMMSVSCTVTRVKGRKRLKSRPEWPVYDFWVKTQWDDLGWRRLRCVRKKRISVEGPNITITAASRLRQKITLLFW